MPATPPRRREHGSGSIYQRASDGRWIGALQAGWTVTGARWRITVSATTKAECQRKLRRKAAELELTGAPEQGVSRHATVKSWADVWLPRYRDTVRATTYTTAEGAVRKWIVPTIGAKRLDALTPGDIRAVHQAITRGGNTTTTARHYHTVLLGMLKAAILEGHPVPQRILLVEAPPPAANDRGAIPLPDALRILESAFERPDVSRWIAGLMQGMRQGETLGLTWDRVDLDRGLLDVSLQLATLPFDKASGKYRVKAGEKVIHLEGAWHLTPVKTSKGKRVVPMGPGMAEALTAWRQVAPESRYGLVWPRPDGRPRDEKDDRLEWQAIQKAAGVSHPSGRPYQGHEMRHTAATLLLAAQVDPEIIKMILGHSSVLTTMGYAHTDVSLLREALGRSGAMLGLTPQIEGAP